MGTINFESVVRLAEAAYIAHARSAFGEGGALAFRRLLDNIRLIYQQFGPDRITGRLCLITGIKLPAGASALDVLGEATPIASIERLAGYLCTGGFGNWFIEIREDGTFRVIGTEDKPNVAQLAVHSLVYVYHDGEERLFAGEYEDVIPKLSPALLSNFAIPTFADLEDALRYYGEKYALHTRCKILASCWINGQNGERLVFANKPERYMRDSLCQALDMMLRSANARAEQNTDESKPVDIRVEWWGARASAIIEVKWLGRSAVIDKSGNLTGTYTDYGRSRAQDGADQLADYLEREVQHSHATSLRGYLVVFDGRRKNIMGPSDRLTKGDATFFENRNLTYNPNHSQSRNDFAAPHRFFMVARESFFVEK